MTDGKPQPQLSSTLSHWMILWIFTPDLECSARHFELDGWKYNIFCHVSDSRINRNESTSIQKQMTIQDALWPGWKKIVTLTYLSANSKKWSKKEVVEVAIPTSPKIRVFLFQCLISEKFSIKVRKANFFEPIDSDLRLRTGLCAQILSAWDSKYIHKSS